MLEIASSTLCKRFTQFKILKTSIIEDSRMATLGRLGSHLFLQILLQAQRQEGAAASEFVNNYNLNYNMSAKLNIHVVDMEANMLETAKQVSQYLVYSAGDYCRV